MNNLRSIELLIANKSFRSIELIFPNIIHYNQFCVHNDMIAVKCHFM